MQTRHNTDLDFIRAILILLMILIHIVSFGNAYPHLKAGILSFMMPTFLLITGYLVNIEKTVRQFGKYLLGLALPYVIMVTGFSILSYFLPVRDGITELSVTQVARKIFITSIGPYWFIQTMIVCGTLYFLSFKACEYLGRRWQGKNATVTTRLFIFAILLVLTDKTPVLSVSAAAYYFAGAALRQSRIGFNRLFQPSPIAFILWALILYQEERYGWEFLAVMFSCWCCISTLMWLHRLPKPQVVTDTLLYIGRNTLPIYLFHPIFTMAAKFYRPLFAFDKTEILMALVTIAIATVGSIVIAKVMEKTRLTYLFGKSSILR